jgi:hypothetical protein
MGDHLCTCTAHSGSKKAHDWSVVQLADLFHTSHTVKTQHVTKSRGRHCGDIELETYLAHATGPVPLVLDLRITHDRFGTKVSPDLPKPTQRLKKEDTLGDILLLRLKTSHLRQSGVQNPQQ